MGKTLTTREVIRRIEALGGRRIRVKGSHATYEVVVRHADGSVRMAPAQVPIHGGDVPPGTLRSIQRQLGAVLGEGWLIR